MIIALLSSCLFVLAFNSHVQAQDSNLTYVTTHEVGDVLRMRDEEGALLVSLRLDPNVYVYDVSNSSRLQLHRTAQFDDTPTDMAIIGDWIIATTWDSFQGIHLEGRGSWRSPVISQAHDLVELPNHRYAVARFDEFWVGEADLADGKTLGHTEFGIGALGCEGDICLVADMMKIYVKDASSIPPRQISTTETTSPVTKIAYVGGGNWWLASSNTITDLSGHVIKKYGSPVVDIRAKGNYVVVTTWDRIELLYVGNGSHSTKPIHMGHIVNTVDGNNFDQALLIGQHLYVTRQFGGIEVYRYGKEWREVYLPSVQR